MLAIHELERQGSGSPEAVQTFLDEHDFPLVEGRTVTFVYCGEAHAVYLHHWIKGLESSQPFVRLKGTDLWFFVMDLPEKSRVEYKLGIELAGQQRLISDPLNPHHAQDPFGANSVVHASGYEIPQWTLPNPNARQGELHPIRMQSQVFQDVREVEVYLPARFRNSRRYPLLIVHDGPDFLRFADLQTVLDNLIHRLEIPPMVVALIGSNNRLHEYADDKQHAEFVATELLPLLEERFPIIRDPSARGLLGSSFGAIAALSTAWRNPGIFANLILLSGSFVFTDIGDHEGGPAFDPVVNFVNNFRREPGKPVEHIYLSCGTYEPLIYFNRSMVPFLQSTGMSVRYSEARDGHNWHNWRDRLREAISSLFPGPLWMVYE